MKAVRLAIVLTVVAFAAGLLIAGCKETGKPATPPADPAATQIAQKTCPVMGGPIDAKVFTDYNGRRIYFCCQACVAKFKADPEKYIAKVDEELKGAAPAGPAGGAGEAEKEKPETM